MNYLKLLLTFFNFSDIKGTLSSKVVKDTGKVFSSSILATGITFIGSLVTLKVLEVNAIGSLVAYNNIGAIVAGIALSGINISFVRYLSLYLKKDTNVAGLLIKKIFILEFLLGVVSLIILFIFAPTIANSIFHKPELALFIKLAGINILFSIVFSFFKTLFQSQQKFTLFSVLTFSQATLTTLVIILFTVLKMLTAVNVIYIGIASNLIFIFIGLFYFLKYRVIVKTGSILPRGLLKEMFHYSKWLIVMAIASLLFQKTDIFMLTSMVSLDQVAYYSFANTIYATFLIILTAINTVLLPKISSFQKPQEFIGATKKIQKFSFLITIIILPTFFFIKPLTILIFQQKFTESMPVLYVLLISLVVSIILNPIVNMLLVLKKVKFMSMVTAAILVLNIIGNIIFIPKYGIMGAVWVTVISYITSNVVLFIKIRLELKKMSQLSKGSLVNST
ncbi:oligosaccharide flippase family protein [Patescibacteria group bacterium]|nr:oligosaccharide flippase family protein [Patescibacteria group bacterium]MBU0963453.1 oligosaccharide flippase family protein [Patescibacteria group bacterium]